MTSGGAEESSTAVFVPPISIPTSNLLSDVFKGNLLFQRDRFEAQHELPSDPKIWSAAGAPTDYRRAA
jgi:hypothetical protein